MNRFSQLLTTESKCNRCGHTFSHSKLDKTLAVLPVRDADPAILCPKCMAAFHRLQDRLARLRVVELCKFVHSPEFKGVNTDYFVAHGKIRKLTPKPKPKPKPETLTLTDAANSGAPTVSLKPSELSG